MAIKQHNYAINSPAVIQASDAGNYDTTTQSAIHNPIIAISLQSTTQNSTK